MNRWCEAGNQHIWLRNNLTIQLCCSLINSYNHSFTIKNPSDLIKIMDTEEWKNKYKILETGPLQNNDCSICIDSEARVAGDSQRNKLKSFTSEGFFLKIDFSNKCNLKCVMCNSSRSSNWLKDEKKMSKMLEPNGINFCLDPHTTLGKGWWLDIPISWWKKLGAVEISGGEPLYQEEALEFLDFLASQVPNIRLNIISNTTMVSDDIIKLFKSISNTYIVCSVDAWENTVYNYARRGTHDLDSVKSNIIKLHQHGIKFCICDTVHCITYDQYDKGTTWLKDNNINVGHIKNFVYTPELLNVDRALPKNINPKSTEDQSLRFYQWVRALDTVRGTNVLSIRPEFKNWFESLEKNEGYLNV